MIASTRDVPAPTLSAWMDDCVVRDPRAYVRVYDVFLAFGAEVGSDVLRGGLRPAARAVRAWFAAREAESYEARGRRRIYPGWRIRADVAPRRLLIDASAVGDDPPDARWR